NLEQYLQATGQEPQAFIDEIRVGAARAVLADLALRAVVAQEEISATDEEVETEVTRLAERANQKPDRVRRELERSGALETVRSDVARGKALEFLVEHTTVVDEDGNAIDISADDNTDNNEPTVVDVAEDNEEKEESEACALPPAMNTSRCRGSSRTHRAAAWNGIRTHDSRTTASSFSVRRSTTRSRTC